MPELPEVETTRRGIEPHVLNKKVQHVVVRQPRLRYPLPPRLARALRNKTVNAIERRGKYLLLRSSAGTVIIHLGMSGSLRIVQHDTPPEKHDHVDIIFSDGCCLRFRDPRRFGCVLWTTRPPLSHPLLKKLGCEPLQDEFDGDYLFARSRSRSIAVKPYIMDSHVVVGVGNIYASEALFCAGIHPERSAGRISLARYRLLATAIKDALTSAIAQGGTTLRDFYHSDGQPGYFQQQLNVYGRGGEACLHCGTALLQIRQAQRTTCYCGQCQR
ncbi:MAG: bifunctional DNA-formamidopyrimidine glycosylase/DNA-(apurinic or apyrimidinic site) lyase [Gammaproteobacteria bacterium]|nr:bifunctional DNA-formamidopyrimidine glycosylase/DNA-(apurinic or apyrimidinic site) lyase [Gammaproteobacteria bacterium]